jgi:hypothetical protein
MHVYGFLDYNIYIYIERERERERELERDCVWLMLFEDIKDRYNKVKKCCDIKEWKFTKKQNKYVLKIFLK